jgi:hypothetical protein
MANKRKSAIFSKMPDIIQAAREKVVECDHRVIPCKEIFAEMASDKARAACEQNTH